DDREHLTRVDVIAQAPDRRNATSLGGKGHRQTGHLEERAHLCLRSRPLPGSNASRRPSPTRTAQNRMTTSRAAGNKNTHGNVVAELVPSAISVPSDTSG